jgi:hypothetical protein
MQSWTSKPLELPIDFARVSRLDLHFEGIRQTEGSFGALVFLNARRVPREAGPDHRSYAGRFTVFAADGCWGEEDHCDWKRGPVTAFDRRPPHHLTPVLVKLDITDAVQRLGNPERLTVTVHATKASDPRATDVIKFERLTAHAYQ